MDIKCEFCNKSYSNKQYKAKYNLEKHLIHCLLNPDGIPYKCESCGKLFKKRHQLIGHKKCCGKIFTKSKFLKEENAKKANIHCKYCNYENINPYKLGNHISRCIDNPNYDKNYLNFRKGGIGRIVSQETKDKISKSRKEYLRNNPDKVPYLLNHSSKESYPEKYFTEVFKNEGIDVIKSYRIGLYELDFSIPEKKIDIEIDGSQHYLDTKIVESDKRRNDFLKENGWDVIRINWSEYKKLNTEDRIDYISNLKLRLKEYKSIL